MVESLALTSRGSIRLLAPTQRGCSLSPRLGGWRAVVVSRGLHATRKRLGSVCASTVRRRARSARTATPRGVLPMRVRAFGLTAQTVREEGRERSVGGGEMVSVGWCCGVRAESSQSPPTDGVTHSTPCPNSGGQRPARHKRGRKCVLCARLAGAPCCAAILLSAAWRDARQRAHVVGFDTP